MAWSKGMSCQGLVFDGQAVGAGCAAVAMQHGFVGVYGDCGVHGSGMLAGHVDGGHEVGQLAPQSITPSTPTFLGLFQQFVDAVDGYFALAFFHGFVTHGLGEGHDGCDVGVVVDDVRVFGQRLWAGAQLRLRWCLLMFSRLVPIGPARGRTLVRGFKRGSARFAAYTSLNRDGGERPCRCRVVAVCQINRGLPRPGQGDSSPTCPYGLSPARTVAVADAADAVEIFNSARRI